MRSLRSYPRYGFPEAPIVMLEDPRAIEDSSLKALAACLVELNAIRSHPQLAEIFNGLECAVSTRRAMCGEGS